MKRNVSLDEISDGKLYNANDLVKVGCDDCKGCSSCCQGMGTSVVLDPYDIYQLTTGLNRSFEKLLQEHIELQVIDGMILPNLQMAGALEQCTFLSKEGRCSIHGLRPGFCRLFPLGRYYNAGGFQYFLQIHECKKRNRTKVKVRKWLDIPELKKYEDFVLQWHEFLQKTQEIIEKTQDENIQKTMNMELLKRFFLEPYEADREFYEQFKQRLGDASRYSEKNNV